MAQKARKAEEQQRIAAEAAGRQAISNALTAEKQKTIAEENSRQAEQAMRLAAQREEEMLRRAYAADINLAHQSIKNNNLGRALDLLQRYYPQPGKPDLRGWEWRYLWALCRSDAEFELCRFGDRVVSAALSPDGKWAALGCNDGTGVRIWDISGRREVAQLAVGEDFCHASFSPDGHFLAFTSTKSLRLWDCAARQTVAQAPVDCSPVSVGFAADGQSIVTFAEGDAITIWHAKDLHKLRAQKVPPAHAGIGSPFAFSPDLKVAVRVEGEASIVAVDLETGQQRWRVQSDKGFSQAIAISPDGKLLVSGFGVANGSIHVFEMSTGKELAVLPGHRAWISALVFWPDGTRLASASADQTITIWDMKTFQPLRVLQGHKLEVWSLALSQDGRTLLSGSKDGSVLVWDPNKNPAERTHWRLPGRHQAWTFSSDGNGMLTVEAGTSRVLKLTGPKFAEVEELSEIRSPDPASSNSSSWLFSPSATRLAALATNGMLTVWNLDEPRRIQQFPTATAQGTLVAFSGDESKIWLGKRTSPDPVFSSADLFEWDLQTRQLLRSLPGVSPFFSIAADKSVFGQGDANAGMFQDLSTGKTYRPVMFPGRLSVLFGFSSFSPDGTLLVVSHDVGLLTVWKTEDLRSNPNPNPIWTLGGILMSFWSSGFSPDGTRLFGCSYGAEAIKIWDTASYNELLTLSAEAQCLSPPRISLDRQYLATSAGNQIFVWRAAPGSEIKQAEALGTDPRDRP